MPVEWWIHGSVLHLFPLFYLLLTLPVLLCGSGSKNVLKTDPQFGSGSTILLFIVGSESHFFVWIRSKFFLSLFGFIHKIPICSCFNSTGTSVYGNGSIPFLRTEPPNVTCLFFHVCLQRPAVALHRMARRLSPRMPASFRSVYTSTLILSSVASCHSRYLFKFLFLKRLLVQ